MHPCPQTSRTTARKRNPASVGTYVMSATQSWLGSSVRKVRATRSSAGWAWGAADCRLHEPSAAHARKSGGTHQASDALATDANPVGAQIAKNARGAARSA